MQRRPSLRRWVSGESSRHDGAFLHHRRPGCDAHRGVWNRIVRLAAAHEPVDESLRRLPRVGDCDPTTVGRPRWFPHPYVHARHCTPYGVFRVYDHEAEYRDAYIAASTVTATT